jgi:hypothetical protein
VTRAPGDGPSAGETDPPWSGVGRRGYLSLVGAAAGGTALAGRASGQSGDCPGDSELAAKRRRLAEVRSELASVRSGNEALVAEIGRRRAEKRRRRTQYDESTRARARRVGVDARESVVRVSVQGSDLFGWALTDEEVVTHTLVLDYRGTDPGATAEATLPGGGTATAELLGRTGAAAPGLALWRVDADLPALPRGDPGALDPGDMLVGVTDVPDRESVITLGELTRRVPESPASLASSVPAYGAHGGVVLTLAGDVVGTVYGSGPGLVDDAPAALDGPVLAEAIPWLSEYRHVPLDTVVDRAEGWR